MTIKAIITTCGYVETNRMASNLWCPYIDSEEMTVDDAMKRLAFDLLRTYEASDTFDFYYEYDFLEFILNSLHGEIDGFNWVDDDYTTFTPFSSFKELFYIEKFETIIIPENFEKIILSYVDEDMLKKVFGTDIKYDKDDFELTDQKCIRCKRDEDSFYCLEFDYEKWQIK